jgi:hypothetical protein
MVRIIAVACCLVLLGAPARPSAQTPVSTLILDEAMSLAGAANPTVRAKVALLRDTYLPKMKQARDTVECAYQRGGVTLLDFLDAQRTYREKSLDYFRSLGNYHTALYQLEAAIGGPLEK